MSDDWKLIQSVIRAHEATDHAGAICTCPRTIRALKAARAFERQFGTKTRPGVILDSFDERTGRWRTKSWMDSDSVYLSEQDWRRLPRAVQQRKLAELDAKLEQGRMALESSAPGAPKRRSPRQRVAAQVDRLLKGAVPTGDGTYTFVKSVVEDIKREARAAGVKEEDITNESIQAWATRKLEADARKQGADLGWSRTSLSDSAQDPPSPPSSSEASPPATPAGPDSPSEPSTSSPAPTSPTPAT